MNLEERQGIIERLCLYIANLENENVEEPAPSQEEKTEIPNFLEIDGGVFDQMDSLIHKSNDQFADMISDWKSNIVGEFAHLTDKVSKEEKTEIPNLIERRCDLCEWGTPLKADEENCFSNNCILCHFGACEGLCAVDFWCSHFEAKK